MAPSRTTFGAFLTETWLPAQRQRLRPSIFDDYDQRIHRHILPRLGRIEMQDLHALMLDQLYADLLRQVGPRGRPLAAKTVRNVHVIVRKALRDASRKRLVSRNVALDADPPKVIGLRERGLTVWSPEELTAFLTGIARHRLAPAFHLAASTGMRRGEVLGVRWCDVDLVLEPHMGAPDGKPRIRRRLWNERREPENGQRRWPVVERPPPPRCLSGLHGRQLLQITTQKRHRLQATTAQNTDKDPIWPQSMATTSPGSHPPRPADPTLIALPRHLGGDPPSGLCHPFGDQGNYRVVVVGSVLGYAFGGSHHSLHGLGGGSADGGSPSISTYCSGSPPLAGSGGVAPSSGHGARALGPRGHVASAA